MEKLTLNNGKTVGLMVTPKGLLDFQKTHNDFNIVKTVMENKGGADFETLTKVLYIGYNGGGNPPLPFDEFVELLPMDLNEFLIIFTNLMTDTKNKNSKKR